MEIELGGECALAQVSRTSNTSCVSLLHLLAAVYACCSAYTLVQPYDSRICMGTVGDAARLYHAELGRVKNIPCRPNGYTAKTAKLEGAAERDCTFAKLKMVQYMGYPVRRCATYEVRLKLPYLVL